jgi:hypothetical protein
MRPRRPFDTALVVTWVAITAACLALWWVALDLLGVL